MGAVAGAAGGLRKVVAGESRISSIDGERGVPACVGPRDVPYVPLDARG